MEGEGGYQTISLFISPPIITRMEFCILGALGVSAVRIGVVGSL